MATKLKGLVVDRVDLVDMGANYDVRTGDGAHILLYKRADGKAETPADRIVARLKAKSATPDLIAKAEAMARTFDEILAGQKARRALDQLWDLYYAFMDSAQSIFASDEADKIGMLRESAVDFLNAFLGALPEAIDDVSEDVEKVGRKISGARMKQLQDMHAKLGSLLTEVLEGEKPMAKTDAEIAAENANVQKRIDDAVKAATDTMTVELQKRDALIATAQAEARTERDLRVLKMFEAQATTDFAGLSLQMEKKAADTVTDAEVFKAISEKAPEEWKRVEAILKGAAEAVRLGKLYGEQGASGSGAEAGSAEAQLFAMADQMVAKKEAPTREQAIAKLASDSAHADLYSRYVDETRARTRH